MDIELKIDEKYKDSKIIIYTDKVTNEISSILDELSSINNRVLKAYKDEKLYILEQKNIESIYSESGQTYLRCNNDVFLIKKRLYELELLLDNKIFLRISNSEIINFTFVKNIDFKILGTLALNFKSGYTAYSSRRYIPKIKEYLDI